MAIGREAQPYWNWNGFEGAGNFHFGLMATRDFVHGRLGPLPA